MPVLNQKLTDAYALYHGDSCETLPIIPSESVGHVIYSPPFATDGGNALYCYSSSDRDISNARTLEEFIEHYEIIVAETARVLMPGRIAAVHLMDVPKNGANCCGYFDLPGEIIKIHERHGFEYTPRICIWKEPLSVRLRTMSKALAHKQIVDDSTQTNIAAADYLIPFRKKGTNPIPVTHPTGIDRYAGEREVPHELHEFRNWKGKQTENRYSHWIWRNYASCFWDDIRGNTGNRKKGDSIRDKGILPFKEGRDDKDERHMHPLQLDVIERACVLWTNPGETVLSPFMGVGSEVWGAVVNGRRGIGIELKESYYRQAVRNLEGAECVDDNEQMDLFSGDE